MFLRVIRQNNLRWVRYEGYLRRGAHYIKYWSGNIKGENVLVWKIT
jgi:hypothetical protein